VDVPHLRSLESAVRNDFDELIGSFFIGQDKSYVIRGFELNMVGAIGSSANSLQMIVDGASMFHGASAESGTFFQVPEGALNEVLSSAVNTKVEGAFTPNALNYVGLEFTREVDNSTAAQLFLWDATNKTEFPKTAPLAQTFDYKIVISSSIWDSNVLPISIVETDSSNNTIKVQDNRPLLFRLGSAGTTTPNPFNTYGWDNQVEGREENFWESSSSVSPFRGGDKQILQFKEWADAVMSSLLEVKGTPYWYSESAGGSLVKLRSDLSLMQLTGSGKFSHSAITPGQLNWDSDLFFKFIGSRLSYKIDVNAASTDVTLADNQVAYIKLVRGVDIVPNLVFTNASSIVTSVGAVSWTNDILAGDYIKVADQYDTQYFEVASIDSASQVTLTETYDGTSTGSAGTKAKYAWGTYQSNPAPSTDRHVYVVDNKDVPFDEDVYWLVVRDDTDGSTARLYLRGAAGGELEQGEDQEISDNTTLNVLDYIGSQGEVDKTPDYTNAIVVAAAEVTTLTFPAGAGLTAGQHFLMNSALNLEKFYADVIVDAADADPTPIDRIRIPVSVLSTDTNLQIAAKFFTEIDALGFFNVVNNGDGTLTITNSQVGATDDIANADMPAPFAVNVDTQGLGSFNFAIVDDENLTISIKRLDEAVHQLDAANDIDPYEEPIEIVVGAPSSDREITGPVVAATAIKIPKNTRNSNVQESYDVAGADLALFLNGSRLKLTDDYSEDSSTEFSLTFDLVVGDKLVVTKTEVIGNISAGGASGLNLGTAQDADVFKQTVGDQLQFRRIAQGSGMTIVQDAEKITFSSTPSVANQTVVNISGTNHVITSNEDVILAANAGSDITVTLPDATVVSGKIINIKKIDAGNTMFIKSVSGQTLDGVNIDAAPLGIPTQFENITVVSNGVNWFIL
jgi:hypothetical protein